MNELEISTSEDVRIQYSRAPVSTDSVSPVSVTAVYRGQKKWKIKEIHGS
jgi:hypothetical protein